MVYLHLAILSLASVTAIILHRTIVVFTFCFPQINSNLNCFDMNMYVSNLSFNVQDDDLRDFFAPYGEVTSARVINDKATGQSRGFGFVEMKDDAAARKAMAELNDATVDGRNIKVVEARPKEGGSSFRGNGGGGFRNKRW